MRKKLVNEVIHLRNNYLNTFQKLQNKHQWKDDDARLGIFAKCLNAIEPVMYSLYYKNDDLCRKIYHKKFHPQLPTNVELQKINDYYIRYLQYSYAILFASNIESSFRIFVREIDSSACSNGKANFQSIFKYLLKKAQLKKYNSLLELWRLIRNCQHNNGTHMSKNEPYVKIPYRNRNYIFKDNEFVKFVNFEFLLNLSEDSLKMLEEVIEAKVLRNDHISDPTYYV